MLSITIPLWLLLTAAGLPALILIGLGVRMIRLKRNKEALAAAIPTCEAPPAAPVTAFDDRIHRQVLDQQIDAVFDVLTTLIETERCKLKALVNHALPVAEPAVEALDDPVLVEKSAHVSLGTTPVPETAEISLSEKISSMAEAGMAAAEIARQMGVSLSEVALALKMSAGLRPHHVGRKMMAVA